MAFETLHLMAGDLESAGAAIKRAAEILRSGGLVAFPTETVYGLGANALDESAVAGIFEAKGRPAWDPLIVHVSDKAMLAEVAVDIPECAHRLMDAFWPGPLTLLLPRHERVPLAVTAGRPRVGVRMPAHPVARELIRMAGVPIAAPSANTFGHISPTSAAHVLADLDGRIDAVLDGGETRYGLESTVLDACESPAVVYRPGVITLEQIAGICGEARAFSEDAAPSDTEGTGRGPLPSPGLGVRHYAPRAKLLLIDGTGKAQQETFAQATAKALQAGGKVGVMLPEECEWNFALDHSGLLVFRWGRWRDEQELAHRLFAGLRQLDACGATVIVCPVPLGMGLGVAIRDRLLRAAR